MRPVVISVAIVLAGCAGRFYRDIPQTEPFAVITMHQPSSRKATTFLAFDNAECTRTDGMGFMQGFSSATAETKSNTLKPGKRIYILASGLGPIGTPRVTGAPVAVEITVTGCSNLVSFVPEASHTYDVTHIFDGTQCRAQVVDTANQQVPNDLQVHHVPRGCGD